MMRTRAFSWMSFFATMIFVAGCKSSPPSPFAKWADPVAPYVVQEGGSNGFDDFCRAAQMAEKDDPLGYARVSYTEGQKADSLKLLKGAMATLKRGANKQFEFKFSPTRPLQPRPYLGGWRLLSSAIVWNIEDALETNSVGSLIENVKLSERFATRMMQGGAAEANLGITLIDEVRRKIAPRIAEMNPGTLDAIADIYAPLAIQANWIEPVSPNEKEQMKQAVQFLQDEYQKKNWEMLKEQLGAECRDAVIYLEQMSQKDGAIRSNYFQSFAAEIDTEEKTIQDAFDLTPSQRVELEVPKGERPWKRFSKAFFRTMRPLLIGADRTKTRTQLLVLECRIRAISGRTRKVPENLSAFEKNLRTDPYSGNDFSYEAFESEFKLYSVGQDQRDSGGKTDEEFLAPDLRIEHL